MSYSQYLEKLKSSNLCIVGNINRDLKTAPFRAGEHLFADGETSVVSITETIGGGGANSACIAAALGAQVTFVGKVGSDALGTRLEQCLLQHHIRPHLARDPSVVTGTSIALSFDHGQRHFVSSLPNTETLRFEDLDLQALKGMDHLYRADIWFPKPMLFGGNQKLFEAARAIGVSTSIDLNWDPRWGSASGAEILQRKEAVRAVLPLVDVAHGNVRELKEFADAPDLDSALHRLENWGAKSVVVHLGAQGAGYYEKGQLIIEPPVPAKQQVNTTGTGDVLSACMMLLHSERDVPSKLRFANQVVTEFIEGKRELIPVLGE